MKSKKKRPEFRLCNDSVFKEIFSKVPNALILLVSDVFNLDYDAIKENTKIELASELSKTREKNKTTICDYVVKVGEYFRVNVEINKSYYKGLTERNLLYAGRLLSESIKKGENYSVFPKYRIFQLNINTFRNFNGKTLCKAKLLDEETGTPLTEAMSLYNLDIEKCYKIYYNKIACEPNISSRLIKWGTILYTTDIDSIADIMGEDFMTKEDKEKILQFAYELDENERTFTDEEMIQLTEWKMEAERLAAREQGNAEGHAEGRAEGIEQQLKETVIKMLNKNYSLEEISDITDLNKEEIMKIKEENK